MSSARSVPPYARLSTGRAAQHRSIGISLPWEQRPPRSERHTVCSGCPFMRTHCFSVLVVPSGLITSIFALDALFRRVMFRTDAGMPASRGLLAAGGSGAMVGVWQQADYRGKPCVRCVLHQREGTLSQCTFLGFNGVIAAMGLMATVPYPGTLFPFTCLEIVVDTMLACASLLPAHKKTIQVEFVSLRKARFR